MTPPSLGVRCVQRRRATAWSPRSSADNSTASGRNAQRHARPAAVHSWNPRAGNPLRVKSRGNRRKRRSHVRCRPSSARVRWSAAGGVSAPAPVLPAAGTSGEPGSRLPLRAKSWGNDRAHHSHPHRKASTARVKRSAASGRSAKGPARPAAVQSWERRLGNPLRAKSRGDDGRTYHSHPRHRATTARVGRCAAGRVGAQGPARLAAVPSWEPLMGIPLRAQSVGGRRAPSGNEHECPRGHSAAVTGVLVGRCVWGRKRARGKRMASACWAFLRCRARSPRRVTQTSTCRGQRGCRRGVWRTPPQPAATSAVVGRRI